ncbi:MAG: response regulator [Proteobacteria bacterium]|nr:response regulator [Pseudomonadota bacterium]MBU1710159.1 response regulator [Pseudomonadota bacterium]
MKKTISKNKVLIIDDEIEFAETCAECLALRDFEVMAFGDANEAMNFIRSDWKPDVVLLDLKMPEIDGLEVLDMIKNYDPRIEVILITAHGSTEHGISGMQRGLFDFLMKPVELDELVEKIHQAINLRLSVQD